MGVTDRQSSGAHVGREGEKVREWLKERNTRTGCVMSGPSCQRWREDWLERIPLHHVKFPSGLFSSSSEFTTAIRRYDLKKEKDFKKNPRLVMLFIFIFC